MAFANKNPKIPEGINTSQEHPLKDFMLLFTGVTATLIIAIILLTVFAQSLAQYIPFRYEQKLSGIYEQALAESDSQQVDSTMETMQGAETAVQELGVSLSDLADLPEGMRLHFHLLDAPDTPNAFATLGGHIFVTTGLLKEITSENALSLVVAHEISHIKNRHPIQALSSGLIIQFALGIVIGNQGSTAIQNLLGQTSLITLLSFNREMEFEADRDAQQILFKKYGHIHHADEFFRKVALMGHKAGWKEIFQTHPDIDKRIENFNLPLRSNSPESSLATPLDSRIVKLQDELDSD